MAVPVKVSDRLLALAKEEARGAQRSATAQIEHWATLGRAVEALVAHQEVLALKRVGQTLPIPAFVPREELREVLWRLIEDADREKVRARVRAAGTPVYTTDRDHPDLIIEVHADGTRIPGRLEGRRFVPAGGGSTPRQ